MPVMPTRDDRFACRPVREGTSPGLPVIRLTAMLLFAFTACTFDYTESAVEARRTDEIPQVEVLNVRMVVERENRLELTARRMATYRERRLQEFEELHFSESGTDGEIRVEGYAERGELNLDTEDVNLLGEVWFYSRTEDARLESSFLYWDNAERVLRGEPDGTVKILRDDGSWVEGQGLVLDGRRNSVELTGGLEGEFITDGASP